MPLHLFMLFSSVVGLGARTPDRVDLVFVGSAQEPAAAAVVRLCQDDDPESDKQRYSYSATSWLDRASARSLGSNLTRQRHRIVYLAQPGLDVWPAAEGYSFKWHADGGLEIRLGHPTKLRISTGPIPSAAAQSLFDGACLRDHVVAQMTLAGRRRAGRAQVEICSRSHEPSLMQPGQLWIAAGGAQLDTGSLIDSNCTSEPSCQFQWLAGIGTARRRWPQALRVIKGSGVWSLQRHFWDARPDGDGVFDAIREAVFLSGQGLRGTHFERGSAILLPIALGSENRSRTTSSPTPQVDGSIKRERDGGAELEAGDARDLSTSGKDTRQ